MLKIIGSKVKRPTSLVTGIIIRIPTNTWINDIISKNPEYLKVFITIL